MPWDSQAERERTELGNEAADTRVGLNAKWQEDQEQLGMGAGADNPYSQAALLKQQRDSNQRGITNTAGANLYAGSTVNAQRQATSQYDQGYQQLQDAYARGQAAINRGLAQTGRDEQLGKSKIQEGAIGRAAASEPAPMPVGGRGRPARGRPAARPRGRARGGFAGIAMRRF